MVGVGEALGRVLDGRRYAFTAGLVGASFALYQFFSTGTIYYDPNPTVLFAGTYPSVWVYRSLSLLGVTVPAWEVDLSAQLTFFLNPQVLILLVTESLLVAVNAALALYLFDQARSCRTVDGRRRGVLASFASATPGVSMLGCCGGAFLSVLTGLGAGVGLVQFLSPESPYNLVLAIIPALVMYLNILWMAPRVSAQSSAYPASGAERIAEVS